MPNSQTDEQLLCAYQQGDVQAFNSLYSRYRKMLYQYFFYQVRSAECADELHQELWLRIIKAASGFNQQARFKTWLFKIAHHLLIDYYRHNSTRSVQQVDNSADENSRAQQCISDPKDQPDTLLQAQQLGSILLDALNALPNEQREVFLLHEKKALSLQEIALISDSSFEAVKSRLRYAVKKLRQNLSQQLTADQ